MSDRAEFIEAVRAQSWDEGDECPTCHGNGRVKPSENRIVHCVGTFTGADWSERAVIEAIETAQVVKWLPAYGDYQLGVRDAEGKTWRFQVKRPAEPVEVGGADQ